MFVHVYAQGLFSLLHWNKILLLLLLLKVPSESVADNTLRKHTYSNILKILLPKTEKFQIKNSDIFHISAQNIDCGYSLEPPRQGGSNENPLAMF